METRELRKAQRPWIAIANKARENMKSIPDDGPDSGHMKECAETIIGAADAMDIYYERMIELRRDPRGRRASR